MSRVLITVGGIGTIVAVITVCLFLVAVVAPMFMPAASDLEATYPPTAGGPPVHLEVDEYVTMGYVCHADGSLTAFRPDDGTTLWTRALADETPTAASHPLGDGIFVLGFADGTVRAVRTGFATEFLDDSTVPESLFDLERGEARPYEDGMVQRTPEDQFRLQTLTVEPVGRPQSIAAGPIVALGHADTAGGLAIVAIAAEATGSRLLLLQATESEDFMTGGTTLRFEAPVTLPYSTREGVDAAFLTITGVGQNVVAAWPDGHAVRISTAGEDDAFVAERLDLVADPAARLTVLDLLLGGGTLVAGDSRGGLCGWYIVDGTGSANAGRDGFRLIPAKRIAESGPGAVTTLGMATRRRMFAAGFETGDLRIYYMTGENELARLESPDDRAIRAVAIAPKEDAVIAVTDGGVARWAFEPGYPEATFSSLFAPMEYEGYAEPEFSWQSSAATDDFEPKLSLVPLIFGTVKATIYSMLFGAPLAILAAIYTSEFLDPRWKAWIKPAIEMMASLPSVVLGFLAALVIAPYIERVVPTTLVCLLAIPFMFLLGSFLWQMLPSRFALRWARHRIVFILVFLPPALALGVLAGPAVETLLFGGDIASWLNGLHAETPVGRPLGGWVLMLLPFAALATAFVTTRYVNPHLRRATETVDRRHMAFISLVKFLAGAAVTVAAVIIAGLFLGAIGLDIRKPLPLVGSIADTYDQRNALIVGFVMGFAIIPIIYTIADDALSTVPGHLRSASLGAGATPWQTAVRIIIPTAMSGLFSALMIGLGRAVGETMIVLMAAGNTPVMNLNMFEGFRTLSANIAVELPEAPVGDTHYRTLFLAALTLFAMTFVVNTVAEAIRLRFRRRAYQL